MIWLGAIFGTSRVALAATLGLVLQMFLGGLASGAMASPGPRLDVFGNPLCITSPHGGSDELSHSGVADCCVPGCPMAALAMGTVDGGASYFVPSSWKNCTHRVLASPHVCAFATNAGARPRAPPFPV